MTESERQWVTDLRRALLHLHKTLLDWEHAAYEKVHGRVTGHQLLHAILNDSQFAWLRPLSELIVRIDETLEQDDRFAEAEGPRQASSAREGDIGAIIAQARTMVVPDESGAGYAQRYYAALQEHPDAVLAHRGVTTVLRTAPEPQPRTH